MLLLLGCVFVASAALSPTCYSAPVISRIVGGTAAAVREFPFLASVQTDSTLCGGSLIAPGWVLTAAHCGNPTKVVMGMYRFSSEDGCQEHFTVKKAIPHPQYADHKNDIMLLQLSGSSTYPPIKLWDGNTRMGNTGWIATVAGWGTTNDASDQVSDTLMKVDVPIQANSVCNQQYSGIINSDMMCAGLTNGGKDSCRGDSGGPLFSKDSTTGSWTQLGIVSFGRSCAQANAFGVYTRVPSFLSWICTNTGGAVCVSGAQVPTTPAPTVRPTAAAKPTQAGVTPTKAPTAKGSPTPACRKCVWCLSLLPLCPPAPATPTPQPTPQPTPRPTPRPTPVRRDNPPGGGGFNVGSLLATMMLLDQRDDNNNNPWDNNWGDNDNNGRGRDRGGRGRDPPGPQPGGFGGQNSWGQPDNTWGQPVASPWNQPQPLWGPQPSTFGAWAPTSFPAPLTPAPFTSSVSLGASYTPQALSSFPLVGSAPLPSASPFASSATFATTTPFASSSWTGGLSTSPLVMSTALPLTASTPLPSATLGVGR